VIFDLFFDHIELHPEVALIVTADHETGGLCLTYRPGRLPTAEDLRALDGVMRSVPARPTGAVDLAEATAIYGQARLPFVAESAWGWNAPGLLRSSERFVSFGSQGHSATPITLFHIGAGAPLPSLMTHADLGARLREWMSIPLPSGGAR
jgi:alkaline phosphatase